MLSSVKKKAAAVVGLSGDRDSAAPRYRAIAPGVIVTDTTVEAWYVVTISNSDLNSEAENDDESDHAETALQVLRGRWCQVNYMWSEISGRDYLTGLGVDQAPDEVREWHAMRADSIDQMSLPGKTVLLSVHLADRDSGSPVQQVSAALGVDERRVPAHVMANYSAQALAMGRALNSTVWRCKLASPELLAWAISRESQRAQLLPTPGRDQVIQGAPLHRLTAGKVVPQPDHLAFLGGDGAPVAYGAMLYLTDFPEEMESGSPEDGWLAALNGLVTSPLGDNPILGGLEETSTELLMCDCGRRVRVPLPVGDDDQVPLTMCEECGQEFRPVSDTAGMVPVLAEPRVRFRPLPAREAKERAEDARKQAKEQRRSAQKSSIEEPDDSIQESEAATRELKHDLDRRKTMLVEVHARLLVTAASREELDAKIAAVKSLYDDLGITAVVGEDEQRELWLESLPGDHVRVDDMGDVMDSTAFVQSQFHAGAKIGTSNEAVPAIGYTTGLTQHLVRFLATEGARRQIAPLIAYLGRTRRGKTVSMMIGILEAMMAPAILDETGTKIVDRPVACIADVKGDLAGLAPAAEHYGIHTEAQQLTGEQDAGALDLFVNSLPEHAVSNAASQLALLAPPKLVEQGSHYIQLAADEIHSADPAGARNWKVVELLLKQSAAPDADPVLVNLAKVLKAASRTGFGAMVAGQATTEQPFPTTPGVYLMQVPGLGDGLPNADVPSDKWDDNQRVRVAALRGLLGRCNTLAGQPILRDKSKIVAIPEVHILTATADGSQYLIQTAKMAAASGTTVMLDTQDASGLEAMSNLEESTWCIFGFAQVSQKETKALARLIHRPEDEEILSLIRHLDVADTTVDDDEDEEDQAPRRGHCIFAIGGKTGRIQWHIPSATLLDLLDTGPRGAAAREQAAKAREAASARQHEADHEAGDEGDLNQPAQEAS